ncbi:glycosyl transferase [Marinilactibacillus sp. 15R]|uniref:beta-1,6-N-acetylglucosaminyltransferase n=2 Tax=Marinilactibacillus TaxID=191769 RepID=UPI0009098724|nr:beta-1,6-N-acetylglucosaminyltransferase [Marinilactibacillus sp. 15R]API89859.1 glycosyl transferase [Marinilactibacillus sp. 15R]
MKKLAYLILAHNDPTNLKRMIDALNEHADFFVHIDKKNDEILFTELFQEYDNVIFISDRYKIYWGGFSIIKAELALAREALSRSYEYSRYILLSGSDYPIKPNDFIRDFFENYDSIQFIRGINLDKLTNKELFESHIDYWQKHDYPFISKTNTFAFKAFRALTNKVLRNFKLSKKIRHSKFDIYQGSQWWALTGDCLFDLVRMYDENRKDYKVFEIIFAPDEKFFHTLFFNSAYASKNQVGGPDKPIYMEKRGKDTSKQTAKLANIHYLDSSMTKWFTEEDYKILKDSDKLFVRKVSTEFSTPLLNKIDLDILRKRNVTNEL